jgi:predicted acetyltransferase
VLGNLGQLYRYDLSGPCGLVPNPGGTFNNRRLDLFLAEADPAVRAWLIMAAGSLGGFVMTAPADGGRSISDFFIVRALRRCGVGREAARQVPAGTAGHLEGGHLDHLPDLTPQPGHCLVLQQ